MSSTLRLFLLQSDWFLSRCLTQLVGHKHLKRMNGRSSSDTKKQRHRATVYTVTRTKRWRNVMPALYKSVNGFKDFPRAGCRSRTENLLCHHSIRRYSISLRLFRIFRQSSPKLWSLLFPLKNDWLHIRRDWQMGVGIVWSITNINWNRPTNERSPTRVIGLITVAFLPSAIKRNWTEHVIVIFRLWRTDRCYI